MPRSFRFVAPTVLALGLLLAGCGDPITAPPAGIPSEVVDQPTGAGTGSGTGPDACGLVAETEVAAILESAAPDEKPITVTKTKKPSINLCQYHWKGARTTGRDFEVAVIKSSVLSMVAEPGQRTPIAGIGEEAFEGMEGNFYAKAGDWAVHVVNVQVTDQASTQLLAAAVAKLG